LPKNLSKIPLHERRISRQSQWIVLLWLVAAVSVGAMAIAGPAGWDVPPTWSAIQAVGQGGSPYTGGIAALQAYHNLPAHAAGDRAPVLYWYPPLTIPLLRALAWLPGWLLGALFACSLAAGFLLQLRAGYLMASEDERRWLFFLLPFAAFFPGLLCDQTILSGNLAFIFYGLALTAAIPGWRQNKWLWFYAAVLAASICKPPMLTLLAFPILVGKRQWAPACIAGASGCAIFAVQPLLWPAQFKEFWLALRLVLDWAHDFGFSPSGLVGRLLWQMKEPYSLTATLAYLAWAAALGTLLLTISRRVRRNTQLRELWIPIAFVGTILLNPRIIFYDTAPLTIPLLLIAWRALSLGSERWTQWRASRAVPLAAPPSPWQRFCKDRKHLTPILAGAGLFAACNIADGLWGDWLPVELTVLLAVFALGIWSLLPPAAILSPQTP
jgi:hypothetical protein